MPLSTRPRSIKEQVHQLIDELPSDCTMDDIHYQLYLMDKINRGEESLGREGGIAHQEMKKRFGTWTSK